MKASEVNPPRLMSVGKPIDPCLVVTVPEAARIAHVPERDLRRAIAANKVRALRWSQRKTFVLLSDVTAWLLQLDNSCR